MHVLLYHARSEICTSTMFFLDKVFDLFLYVIFFVALIHIPKEFDQLLQPTFLELLKMKVGNRGALQLTEASAVTFLDLAQLLPPCCRGPV